MLFNTMEFFFFFLIITPIYFILPHRIRWCFLLAASYYFYMSWNAKYGVLILLSTVVNYAAAIYIHKAETARGKRLALLSGLGVSLGMLFLFKYYNFAVETFNSISLWLGSGAPLPYHSLLLPVGISFFTFQTLSYTLDVYMGKREPERHFGIFALYVSFFPQLVAGPVERSTRLMPQFHEVKRFRWANLWPGLQLIMTGLIKKVVIADRLAVLVNAVYGDIPGHSGPELALATVFFAFQIYCDFSGYTDIAIGTARIMDFDLMKNFDRPYLSRSVNEFWRRWHISLSTWFKDYVYVPLGGNRGGELRTAANLLVVFIVSGVWHGASYNFIIWGALNGFYLVLERYLLSPLYARLDARFPGNPVIALPRILFTFTLITFSWIFFRAATLSDAIAVITAITAGSAVFRPDTLGVSPHDLTVSIAAIACLLLVEALSHIRIPQFTDSKKPFVLRLAVFYAMFFVLILMGVYGANDASQFIYFTF